MEVTCAKVTVYAGTQDSKGPRREVDHKIESSDDLYAKMEMELHTETTAEKSCTIVHIDGFNGCRERSSIGALQGKH